MMGCAVRLELFLFFVIAFSVPAAHAAEPTVNVVEFYNAALKYYFITSDPVEVFGIDSGAKGAGWVRTGGRFSRLLKNPPSVGSW
jgi:hypothetical protein